MIRPHHASRPVSRAERFASVAVVPIAVWLATVVTSSCVYDPNDLCGPHQVNYMDGARCVCKPNAAWTANGCKPCGENEVPGADSCVCKEGYSRPSATAACDVTPSGLGNACDTATPCTAPDANYCAMGESTTGYCTKSDCVTTNDCSGGYACDTNVTPAFCRRPPIGFGKTCTTADDCKGTEATYCDAYSAKVCLVENCSLTKNDCFVGQSCCDLSKFGVQNPICVPGGACP